MVSSTLFPAVHILGSQNVYSWAEGIADYHWPWAVFYFMRAPMKLFGRSPFLKCYSPNECQLVLHAISKDTPSPVYNVFKSSRCKSSVSYVVMGQRPRKR